MPAHCPERANACLTHPEVEPDGLARTVLDPCPSWSESSSTIDRPRPCRSHGFPARGTGIRLLSSCTATRSASIVLTDDDVESGAAMEHSVGRELAGQQFRDLHRLLGRMLNMCRTKCRAWDTLSTRIGNRMAAFTVRITTLLTVLSPPARDDRSPFRLEPARQPSVMLPTPRAEEPRCRGPWDWSVLCSPYRCSTLSNFIRHNSCKDSHRRPLQPE